MDTAGITTAIAAASTDLFIVFGAVITVIIAIFGMRKVYGTISKG